MLKKKAFLLLQDESGTEKIINTDTLYLPATHRRKQRLARPILRASRGISTASPFFVGQYYVSIMLSQMRDL